MNSFSFTLESAIFFVLNIQLRFMFLFNRIFCFPYALPGQSSLKNTTAFGQMLIPQIKKGYNSLTMKGKVILNSFFFF